MTGYVPARVVSLRLTRDGSSYLARRGSPPARRRGSGCGRPRDDRYRPGHQLLAGTRFQIASVTKQFTAAAVLLLADRGVLSVSDPISGWLDGCPAAWDPITYSPAQPFRGLVHWPNCLGWT